MLSSVEIPETWRRSLTALAKNASLDSLRDTLPYFRPKRRAFTPSTRAVHPGGRKIMFDVAVSELTSPRWDLHDEVERAVQLRLFRRIDSDDDRVLDRDEVLKYIKQRR